MTNYTYTLDGKGSGNLVWNFVLNIARAAFITRIKESYTSWFESEICMDTNMGLNVSLQTSHLKRWHLRLSNQNYQLWAKGQGPFSLLYLELPPYFGSAEIESEPQL